MPSRSSNGEARGAVCFATRVRPKGPGVGGGEQVVETRVVPSLGPPAGTEERDGLTAA
jgi:hypothetical protein